MEALALRKTWKGFQVTGNELIWSTLNQFDPPNRDWILQGHLCQVPAHHIATALAALSTKPRLQCMGQTQ